MAKKFKSTCEVVLLNMHKNHNQLPDLLELARQQDWRFFDLNSTRGVVPEGFKVLGAIVDALPTAPLSRQIQAMGCPIVRVGRMTHPLDHLQPVVMTDLLAAGEMAAEHFAARGFKNVGYVGNTPWANGYLLYQGFEKRIAELGKTLHLLRLELPDRTDSDLTFEEYRNRRQAARDRALRRWIAECPKPLGIFAYHDALATNIHLLCLSLDLAVPAEVSILGYGNSAQAETSLLPISSIEPGRESIAKTAISVLKKMMNGFVPDPPRIMIPPTGVVTRQSTDILAVSDPSVARALGFIWEHYAWPITVQDVADASGMPKRTLVRAFQKCLGRSINQELRRKRMEKACELLRSATTTVADIVKLVGFSSNAYFHKRFQEEFGMTPLAFRAKETDRPPVKS